MSRQSFWPSFVVALSVIVYDQVTCSTASGRVLISTEFKLGKVDMSYEPAWQSARSRCATCSVRHKAVCGALNEAELANLNRIAHARRYQSGQLIMSDEEPTDFFANVISGVVKLEKTSADGRQQIVGLLFPPDFLGRAHSEKNHYFAEAATDVEICCFPHREFERMLAASPGLERRLFENTLSELDAARDWMFLLGRKTAEEKVASFLHMIACRAPSIGCHHTAVTDSVTFDLPLTRADIADFLGLTIETVSRQLSRLKKRSAIELPSSRTVRVQDLDELAKIASSERLGL